MLRFEPARLVFYGDLKRCPYVYHSKEAKVWHRRDDKRLLLITLERYIMIFDYLRKTDQYLRKENEHQENQK